MRSLRQLLLRQVNALELLGEAKTVWSGRLLAMSGVSFASDVGLGMLWQWHLEADARAAEAEGRDRAAASQCYRTFLKEASAGAAAALLVGLLTVLSLQPFAWNLWMPMIAGEDALPPPAFPWRMTIASAAAFGVCLLGKRAPQGQQTQIA